MKIVLGLLLAAGIGALTRTVGIPVPAPPALTGALLVLAMTIGYVTTDQFAQHRQNRQRRNCGGPTGTSQGESS